MKRIASFPIVDADKANAFMEKNPPRSTPQQSGIIFHNGFIVIIYDDGKPSLSDKIGFYNHLLEGDREKLWLTEHKIETATLALKTIKPSWYKEGMSKTQIKEKLEADSKTKKDKEGKVYIPTEEVDTLVNEITNLENQLVMDKHEFNRLSYEIGAYEKQLLALKK